MNETCELLKIQTIEDQEFYWCDKEQRYLAFGECDDCIMSYEPI